MKTWIMVLKGFGYVWLTLAGLLILAGIAGVWMKEGFSAVQDLLSPFNIVNWLVTLITLAPGIGALMWVNKLKKKYVAGIPSSVSSPATDRIINKGDADYIFSLNLGEWEAYAQRMVHPNGWKVQLSPHDTGTGVMSFDPDTGFGLSVHPIFDNNEVPPTILTVGSYYPLGSLPSFTEDFKKKIEKDAMKDLGVVYSVSASFTKIPPFEGIELMVMKKSATPN